MSKVDMRGWVASSVGGLAGRFFRRDGGSVVVEAALLAPLFIFLVSITMEVISIFLVIRALDNATDAAARQVRVGNKDVMSGSGADFRTLICRRMPAFTDCDKKLVVKVVSSPQFDTLADALSEAVATEETPAFDPGVPRSYVAVEAVYTWEFTTPLFFTLPDEQKFTARTAFRNEPFDGG